MMQTVLCYGDSNTWGASPDNTPRMDSHTRWAGVLRDGLGADYQVVEEGLNGRTTAQDDPFEGIHKNGRTYLLPCLQTHAPIDLVILMLGTNDLKKRFDVPASDVARGIGVLADIILTPRPGADGGASKLLIMSPPPFAPMAGLPFDDMFTGGEEKSRHLARFYAEIAVLRGCAFFDAGSVIVSSRLDGIHFDASEHRKLGAALIPVVQNLLA
ncbi:MAG: SGNH/GDSL hydrolase family protein [Chloroflexota bacterium]|nr:SGNH/GDSL hydrolase family protein [Chloroflexota bacterium]